VRVRRLVGRGLVGTRDLWRAIRRAYGWVEEAAAILKDEAGLEAAEVERRYDALLAAVTAQRTEAGRLAGAIDHFLKVTRSYRPGLFACYRVPGLPRTNNDLEHLFGAHRYHERRASGRKAAAPALVLRGPVRLLAATTTRLRPFRARDLARADRVKWATLRGQLADRRRVRTQGARFRRDPEGYLGRLEQLLLQPPLPS
jgi:hypothetical protein